MMSLVARVDLELIGLDRLKSLIQSEYRYMKVTRLILVNVILVKSVAESVLSVIYFSYSVCGL